jgi:hypothetical protein
MMSTARKWSESVDTGEDRLLIFLFEMSEEQRKSVLHLDLDLYTINHFVIGLIKISYITI